ncbi:MAG: hypothetical protein KME15_02160 [Drouetiella hepatica Uher 2000/2452]|jgi:hypothetical protein|uniref:Uncharacterized protein n=1 Tax=Drouetiella hepatica Uher 2000/2452 TaxID=904376 RepID=A0A951Q8L5_9CYAN|nr:hypothetical protein [Drouetiella hepatica Uher 2000/2452]
MMLNPSRPTTLEQAARRILSSGKITTADRTCLLQVALTDHPILPQDSVQVRQILDRLQMGLLRIVD